MDDGHENEHNDISSRLDDELSLLQAMYPGQVEWNAHRREIKFSVSVEPDSASTTIAVLVLRLQDNYLAKQETTGSLPFIMSATSATKQDLRETVLKRWQSLKLEPNEEVLDQLLNDFEDLAQSSNQDGAITEDGKHHDGSSWYQAPREHPSNEWKTIIIWLHHLLATSKRKLALNPTLTSSKTASAKENITGLTKPGYPGVMVFAGPTALVDAHVSELKAERWQAFQVRLEETYENDQTWVFVHDTGIKEVETMSEMVNGIQGYDRRQEFLKAVGVK